MLNENWKVRFRFLAIGLTLNNFGVLMLGFRHFLLGIGFILVGGVFFEFLVDYL